MRNWIFFSIGWFGGIAIGASEGSHKIIVFVLVMLAYAVATFYERNRT